MHDVRALLPLPALLLACASNDSPTPSLTSTAACADPIEFQLPDGTCVRPGIPVDGCAEGFVHDGAYGCEPILPPEPCPPGLIAVPGEDACRPVMHCGEGKWGDIAVESNTQYVDESYAGGDSDGSDARPWTTITAAYAAAAPGALVAIAAGIYHEDVVITGKRVRLHGVCPDEVAIEATGQLDICGPAALCIAPGADDSEVSGIAFGGAGLGIVVSGAERVVVDRVHVRDAAHRGIDAESALGATSLAIRDSLVERNRMTGIFVSGVDAQIDATVVRATQPQSTDQQLGWGIAVTIACNTTSTGLVCDAAERSTATVTGSVIEENHEHGVYVVSSDAQIDASVVRANAPNASDQTRGRGITATVLCESGSSVATCNKTPPATVVVTGSLVSNNHDTGVAIFSSGAHIEASVVRATRPSVADGLGGWGLDVQVLCTEEPEGLVCDPAARANATVTSSLLEHNSMVSVAVGSSDLVVESSVIRDTLPAAADQSGGRGIHLQLLCTDASGVTTCDPAARPSAHLTTSLVEHNVEFGLSVLGSDVVVESSVVRDTSTRASDGLYGDGIAVLSLDAPAALTVTRSRVDNSRRAGVSNFGASATLSGSHVRCAAFALAGELLEDQRFVFTDNGGNLCGCPAADGACQVVSAGLAAPEPLK